MLETPFIHIELFDVATAAVGHVVQLRFFDHGHGCVSALRIGEQPRQLASTDITKINNLGKRWSEISLLVNIKIVVLNC